MRILAMVCLLLSTLSAHAGTIECAGPVRAFTSWYLHDHPDTRVRATVESVLSRANLETRSFAICRVEWFTPMLIPFTGTHGLGFAFLLPPYVSEFSDGALRGLLAHEIGHTSLPMIGQIDFGLEVQADENGARITSKADVVEMLVAIRDNVHRFPQVYHSLVYLQIEYRIAVLTGTVLHVY